MTMCLEPSSDRQVMFLLYLKSALVVLKFRALEMTTLFYRASASESEESAMVDAI